MSASAAAAPINAFDPVEVARANPYYKRNHMGNITCTLCSIYCVEESNFLKHIAGKTHTMQLERLQNQQRRHQRMEEDERLNTEARLRAEREEALQKMSSSRTMLSSSTATGGASVAAAVAAAAARSRFGTPLYSFRTEHDDRFFRTKVWIEVIYPLAEEGTRPLHRWLSSREQQVDTPPDDYYVYLLVACEGYVTIAMRFPANAKRSQAGDIIEESDGVSAAGHLCSWDPLRKTYSLYFVISR